MTIAAKRLSAIEKVLRHRRTVLKKIWLLWHPACDNTCEPELLDSQRRVDLYRLPHMQVEGWVVTGPFILVENMP